MHFNTQNLIGHKAMCQLTNFEMKIYLTLLLLFLLATPIDLRAQFTVSYHQSIFSFAGFNYETEKGWIPEVRLGTNKLFENISFEALINYGFISKPEYTFYGGAGLTILDGAISGYIPVGLSTFGNQ
jgi:hypothetical protein